MKEQKLSRAVIIPALLLPALTVLPFVSLAEKVSEQLEDEYKISTNTLASPLFLSEGGPELVSSKGISLSENPFLFGYEGDLEYEQMVNGVYRLRYHDLKKEAAFFFLLDEPMDLRNRWFRLRYSGVNLPSRMGLEFDHDELRLDAKFDVYLTKTTAIEGVYFKLPDKGTFSTVDSVRLVVRPEDDIEPDADFLILGMELLP